METKSSKSSFCGAYWRQWKHPKKDWKRDGSDSISIFPSRVWTNIFWCTVLEINATQSKDFVIEKNTESMEAECVRVGLNKCFASHRINFCNGCSLYPWSGASAKHIHVSTYTSTILFWLHFCVFVLHLLDHSFE
jgi:hypothetical protein